MVIFLFVVVVHFGHFNLVVQLPVESQFAVIYIKLKKKNSYYKFYMQCLGSLFDFKLI